MPVGRDDPFDSDLWVDLAGVEVRQRTGCPRIFKDTGVKDNPVAVPKMDDNGLPVLRTEYTNFNFRGLRRSDFANFRKGQRVVLPLPCRLV
jgi:hypothetical protein